MSSHDRGFSFVGFGRKLAVGVAALLALSACTVQPLYAPTLSGASAVSALGQIAIDPTTGQPILPTDPSIVTVPPVTDATGAASDGETTPTPAGEGTPASSTP